MAHFTYNNDSSAERERRRLSIMRITSALLLIAIQPGTIIKLYEDRERNNMLKKIMTLEQNDNDNVNTGGGSSKESIDELLMKVRRQLRGDDS